MSEPKAPSETKVEGAKRAGRYLRGTLADQLASGTTHFGPDDVQLLKFHGSYQQDDRDGRKERGEKQYSFMIRAVLPAGVVSAEQYLVFDRLADEAANGTLRITTRQGFQLHGILMGDLKASIAAINQSLATTLAACGDVQRNVLGCPAPLGDAVHMAVRRVAERLAVELRPATRAYYEIWLDEERVVTTEPEEPFYGSQYLPRKFKVAVGISTDNCVDLYANDAGLEAVVEGARVVGFNVLAGGGLGMTHGKGTTVARLADVLGFVSTEDDAVESIRIIGGIFRDHGNRTDRRHARLKYLLNSWGLDRFREEFVRRAAFTLEPPRSVPPPVFHDHLGVHRQEDGRWFIGVFVPSGRIADRESARLKTALRAIAAELRSGFSLTAQQNILITDLSTEALERVRAILAEAGVAEVEALDAATRFSLACPALPTCGLAVAESERVMPDVLSELRTSLTALGLRDAPITIRMTGCPNGCARPYTADLAFVGRSLDLYHIYVGGGLTGDRVVDLYQADVRRANLATAVQPIFERWAAERLPDEGLGDFHHRVIRGGGAYRRQLTGRETAHVTAGDA